VPIVGSFMDLQNVQVLKGPQGTLFGRNTTGGAVLLVPQKPTDKLEVSLRLYFSGDRSTEIHDVDNRLKDCLDALQGRVGGTKTKAGRTLKPIVPNDRQIWRVVVQKTLGGRTPLDKEVRLAETATQPGYDNLGGQHVDHWPLE